MFPESFSRFGEEYESMQDNELMNEFVVIITLLSERIKIPIPQLLEMFKKTHSLAEKLDQALEQIIDELDMEVDNEDNSIVENATKDMMNNPHFTLEDLFKNNGETNTTN